MGIIDDLMGLARYASTPEFKEKLELGTIAQQLGITAPELGRAVKVYMMLRSVGDGLDTHFAERVIRAIDEANRER